jgi:hypothetical protein
MELLPESRSTEDAAEPVEGGRVEPQAEPELVDQIEFRDGNCCIFSWFFNCSSWRP